MSSLSILLGDLSPDLPNEGASVDGATEPLTNEYSDGSSILKLEDPVLARPGATFDMTRGHDSLPQYVSLYASNDRRHAEAGLRLAGTSAVGPGIVKTKRRPCGDGDENMILKAILPNKEFVDEAGEWVQAVSSTTRTREELEGIQKKVDARLVSLQGRPGAVCAVRERIFSELYDEVIREVTLHCPERGLLLLRLRDETRMNLETYAEIYRDSFAFSRRKVEGARQELDGVQTLMKELESQTSSLQAQVRSLEADLAAINRSNACAKSRIDEEHAEELRLVKEERTALEAAISKSRKNSKKAIVVAEATGS